MSDLNKDREKELLRLIEQKDRKLLEYEKTIRGYKGLNAARQQAIEVQKLEKPPVESLKEENTTKEEFKPHYVGAWEHFCPECGDKNPDFKDETICDPADGGCGMHLGAIEKAKDYKACPNCGGQKAVYIGKDPKVLESLGVKVLK